MKQLWQACSNKLVVKLGVFIFLINIFVLSVCFVFQYDAVSSILLEKDEKSSLESFEQSHSNISHFCDQVNLAAVSISSDSNIKILEREKDLSVGEQYSCAIKVLNNFTTLQNYYSFIESISYYGKNGMVLKVDKRNGNSFAREEVGWTDWFYSSDLAEAVEKKGQKMTWYGGVTDLELGLGKNSAERQNYIAAVRRAAGNMGTLVICVDISYFSDIFSVGNGENESIYAIDRENVVVASKNTELLGVTKSIFENQESSSATTRFFVKDKEGEKQVLTYYVSELGWRIARESFVEEVTGEVRNLRKILLISCIISAVISFGFSISWIAKMLKPLNYLVVSMEQVADGKLGLVYENPPENEFGTVIRQFNQMSLKLQNLFSEKERVEKQKQKMEMQALRAQINPHLIYNTLNNIKWMALISGEQNIAESITLLANFLKPIFRSKNTTCSIAEEVDYARNYIAIMNMRGMEGYSLKVQIPEEYYEYSIVKFLLQPVIENSIVHGFAQRESGEICISMWIQGEYGFIQVADNGSGMEEKQLQNLREKLASTELLPDNGIGIVNVNKRIQTWYGTDCGITIDNGEKVGSVVTLKIKMEKKGIEHEA